MNREQKQIRQAYKALRNEFFRQLAVFRSTDAVYQQMRKSGMNTRKMDALRDRMDTRAGKLRRMLRTIELHYPGLLDGEV